MNNKLAPACLGFSKLIVHHHLEIFKLSIDNLELNNNFIFNQILEVLHNLMDQHFETNNFMHRKLSIVTISVESINFMHI